MAFWVNSTLAGLCMGTFKWLRKWSIERGIRFVVVWSKRMNIVDKTLETLFLRLVRPFPEVVRSKYCCIFLTKKNRMVDIMSTGRNDPADRSCVGICMHDIQQSRWRSYLARNVSSLSNYNKALIKRLFHEFTSSLLWINQKIRFHQRNNGYTLK